MRSSGNFQVIENALALPPENFLLMQLVSLFVRFGVAVPTATELWYAANPRFVNRS